jgi:hypothetical protein
MRKFDPSIAEVSDSRSSMFFALYPHVSMPKVLLRRAIDPRCEGSRVCGESQAIGTAAPPPENP